MVRIIYLLLILLLNIVTAYSQSSDDLFSEARKLGFNGERQKARNLCITALEKSPNYSDIRTFLGRLYTWDDMYDSARVCFKETINRNPNYLEAYSAWCDAELWSDNPQNVFKIALQGLSIDSTNADLLLKKSKAHVKLKEYNQALEVMEFALKYNKKNPTLFEYFEFIKRLIQKNKIALSYDHDQFNKTFSPWNSLSLAYTRRTEYLGSVIGRFNQTNRFNSNASQLEFDAYPSLGDKMYAYISAGFADLGIFPSSKYAISLYRSLPKSYEAEIGFRYLKFSTATYIYTGSISKYWKNFWFNLRPSFIPGSLGNSGSINFSSRYYLSSANDYLGATIGTGISPDEIRISRNDGVPNSFLLKSSRVRINYQKELKHNFIIGVSASYAEEQTTFSGFRKNYNLGFNLEKIF